MGKIITERTVFTDGDRFIIMYKNIDEETKQKIMKALATVEADLPEVSAVEEEPVPVYPVEDPVPAIPEIPDELPPAQEPDTPVMPTIRKGPYKGMTPEAVLDAYGDKGYGNLAYLLTKTRDQALKDAAEAAMSAYFKNRFSGVDPYRACSTWSDEDVEKFFSYFGSIVTEEAKKKILEQAGAAEYDAFLNQASPETKKQLAAAIIKKYAK